MQENPRKSTPDNYGMDAIQPKNHLNQPYIQTIQIININMHKSYAEESDPTGKKTQEEQKP